MVNGNAGHAPNTAYFPQVHNFSSVGGSYSLEWDAGHITMGTSLTGGMGSSNVARVYDSFLSTGTTYHFGLRPTAGNTSNYSLALHSASVNRAQGRSSAVADSGNVAPGTPAFIQYGTGGDPSQFDGLVVLNNNSGSGNYTLYRDSAEPSGTIKIDGNAPSTKSTTLTPDADGKQPDVQATPSRTWRSRSMAELTAPSRRFRRAPRLSCRPGMARRPCRSSTATEPGQ